MLRLASGGRLLARLLLFYVLLMAPWPGLQHGYAALTRAAGNLAVAALGASDSVTFRRLDDNRGILDTEILLENRRTNAIRQVPHSTRYAGYLATAFLAALVLATPMSWPHRCWALASGLLLLHACIALKLGCTLLLLGSDPSLSIFAFGSQWKSVLTFAVSVLALPPWFLAPIFLWILVSLRRDNWIKVLGDRAPGVTP